MPFPSCYFVPSCFTLHTCYFMHQFFHASYLLFVICTPTGVFLWIYFRLQASDIYSLAFWFPSFLLFHLHSNDIDTLRSDKAHSPFFFFPLFYACPVLVSLSFSLFRIQLPISHCRSVVYILLLRYLKFIFPFFFFAIFHLSSFIFYHKLPNHLTNLPPSSSSHLARVTPSSLTHLEFCFQLAHICFFVTSLLLSS